MSNRVFSYANWKLFCGFDPMYTEADRYKLQAIDGIPVRQVGDTCFLSHNPLGGLGAVPKCATKAWNEQAITIEQLLGNTKLISEVYYNMFSQATLIPFDFHTISYIDDMISETGAFALTSIHKCDYNDSIVYYNIHKPIALINRAQREQMLIHKLPALARFIPNGFLFEDQDVAVFSMSTEQAVECMLDINPSMHFRFTQENKTTINQYNQNIIDSIDSDEADDIADTYYALCAAALEAFALPHEDTFEKPKTYTARKVSRKHDTISIAEKYVDLQQQLLAAQANIVELNAKVDSLKDPQKTLQEVRQEFKPKYGYLEPEALTSLIEGEASYRDHEDVSEFSFVEVIRSFAAVVEIQLRTHLSAMHPELMRPAMPLGEIIKAIENGKVAPYHKSVSRYKKINDYRIDSSHDAIGSKQIAEEIRNEFYKQRMIEWLK